jgi:hypothetical protein
MSKGRTPMSETTDDEAGYPRVVMRARTPAIGEMVRDCARGRLDFSELCCRVAAMGYRTTSLYEMVRAEEWEIQNGQS